MTTPAEVLLSFDDDEDRSADYDVSLFDAPDTDAVKAEEKEPQEEKVSDDSKKLRVVKADPPQAM